MQLDDIPRAARASRAWFACPHQCDTGTPDASLQNARTQMQTGGIEGEGGSPGEAAHLLRDDSSAPPGH